LERTISKLSLNNTNETLSLFDATGALIDTMTYLKTKEGVSLNATEAGWRGGTPTPGATNIVNSLPETKEKVPKKGYRGVAITFDARGKDTDGGTLKYTWDFGDGHKSYKEKTEHRYEKNGTYQVMLTTTDGSDDVVETFPLKITSLPKPNVRITALVPNPSGKDSDAEWLVIENRGKKDIDLKDYGIATGWKKLSNHPIRESFIIPPQSERKLTREFSLFTLPNQKGKIELRAPDGKVLQDIKYKLPKAVAEDVIYRKEKGKRWEWDETPKNQTESLISGQAPENIAESLISEQAPAEDEEESTVAEEIVPTPSEEQIIEPEQSEPETNNEPTSTEQTLKVSLPETELGDPAVLGASTEVPLPDTPPLTSDTSLILWFKRFLMDWNARLNTWQNNKTAL
jgi:PKD repeat protein